MSGVLGIFEQKEELLKALREASAKNLGTLEAFSPAPDQELIEAAAPGKSPVRWLTLLGGVTGGIGGLALTIWTTAQWPLLITGGIGTTLDDITRQAVARAGMICVRTMARPEKMAPATK